MEAGFQEMQEKQKMETQQWFMPWPIARTEGALVPVCLMTGGNRCVDCPCEANGFSYAGRGVRTALPKAESMLRRRQELGFAPCELALWGGPLANLTSPEIKACRETMARLLKEGLIASWRCVLSTEKTKLVTLKKLAEAGCRRVELNVSETWGRLAPMLRGSNADPVLKAREAVWKAGLECGLQLVAGMPDYQPEDFAMDVELATSLGVDFLVLAPSVDRWPITSAARRKRAQAGKPEQPEQEPLWTNASIVDALVEAVISAHRAHVPVERLGPSLCPAAEFTPPGKERTWRDKEHDFAGYWLQDPLHDALQAMLRDGACSPGAAGAQQDATLELPDAPLRDPLLGVRVRARALLQCLQQAAQHASPMNCVDLPVSVQDHVYGIGGEYRAALEAIGLEPGKIRWVEDDGTADTNRIVVR